MFGIKVIRWRWFELGHLFLLHPIAPNKVGSLKEGDYSCVVGNGSNRVHNIDKMPKHQKETVLETWGYAMGIDWMKKTKELAEAIPPSYTKYIGERIIRQIIY